MTNHVTLVTGAAGFIGFHVIRRLLEAGRLVVGVDSLNGYYDPALKHARLAVLSDYPRFDFVHADLADRRFTRELFERHRFGNVIHLAAQAGVRHSIEHPHAFVDANVQGFVNVLEGCRHGGCGHLIYASSSSVYGANQKLPFSVEDRADHPVSLYAATKRANELMAWSYSHLYKLPVTGLRFFTIYGPWGRPDMAIFLFARAILEGKPIKLFNGGRMRRDFTYIDDAARVIVALIGRVPQGNTSPDGAPARIYNVGNSRPEDLMHVVSVLERELHRTAIKEMLPIQPGDVVETYADIGSLAREAGFAPRTSIEEGIAEFVKWFRGHYGV